MNSVISNNVVSKIGVIGDIHAEDERLKILLEFLASLGLDAIYSVGDIVDGRGSVDQCCELLKKYNVAAVLGNHDQWCLDGANRDLPGATQFADLNQSTKSFLNSLAKTKTITTVSGNALLCHGLGECNMASVKPSDTLDALFNNLELWPLYRDSSLKFILNGHSHSPDVHVFNHLTVINAGALDHDDIACSVVVDFQDNEASFYRLDDSLKFEHYSRSFG